MTKLPEKLNIVLISPEAQCVEIKMAYNDLIDYLAEKEDKEKYAENFVNALQGMKEFYDTKAEPEEGKCEPKYQTGLHLKDCDCNPLDILRGNHTEEHHNLSVKFLEWFKDEDIEGWNIGMIAGRMASRIQAYLDEFKTK